MALRKTPLVRGEFFHIYNRGNSKQKIFIDYQDYDRFLKCLYLSNSSKSFNFRNDIVNKKIDAFDAERGELLVHIGAWVLMPNHFHLYITMNPKSDLGGGEISHFMRKLLTSYAKYFNKKYNRSGGLYEGKFKSQHIDNEPYAQYLFSYIHLNPIKIINPRWKENGIRNTGKIFGFLDNYPWSSFHEYTNKKRVYGKILNLELFQYSFSEVKDFKKYILDWLLAYTQKSS